MLRQPQGFGLHATYSFDIGMKWSGAQAAVLLLNKRSWQKPACADSCFKSNCSSALATSEARSKV